MAGAGPPPRLLGPILIGIVALVAARPPVAEAAPCAIGEGTTVVVDFAAFGGGVEVRCAPTAGTGFEALAEAGFSVTRVQSNPAFLCRIDGWPTVESEPCLDIPPASAYWSYWTARLGGDWSFSTQGAAGKIRGDFEGWAFSVGGPSQPPRYSIPEPPAATTTSTTTTTTTTSPTTTTTTTTTTIAAAITSSTATTATTKTTTKTTTTTTTSTTYATTTAPTTTTATTPDPGAASSPVGLLVTAAIVGVLGVASGLALRRRP